MTDDPMPWDNLELTEAGTAARLARIGAAWRALLASVDGIPASRMDEPGVCGEWSVNDLLGHLAFWARYSEERGRDVLEGRPFAGVEWQEMNDRDIAARAGRAAADNLADLHAAHASMMAFVAAAPRDPAVLAPLLARMGVDTDDHYFEHAAEILAWRQRAGV